MNTEPAIDPVEPVQEWAIVSQMGHVTFCGRISEEERFGGKIGRCDVPQPDGTFLTRYFTAASLYALTPCTEELARRKNNCTPEPVTPLGLPMKGEARPPGACANCGQDMGMLIGGICGPCLEEARLNGNDDDRGWDSVP